MDLSGNTLWNYELCDLQTHRFLDNLTHTTPYMGHKMTKETRIISQRISTQHCIACDINPSNAIFSKQKKKNWNSEILKSLRTQ